jgi:hypothetical protein
MPVQMRHMSLGSASRLRAAIAVAALGCLTTQAHAQLAVQNQGYIPYSDAPINYRSAVLSDPVAKLQQRLDQGQASLQFDQAGHGYLRSVLKLLDIPINSQTLVFSKTSFQYPKISPDHPRALYFNDDVYIGSVHQGSAIEVISFDPMQGAIFYLLDEHKVDRPTFQRAELDCTQCHIAAGTRGIPGVLLRSVYPTAAGTLAPGSRSYVTDQESPFNERWGGWYVTGFPADVPSMGNAVVSDALAAAAGTTDQLFTAPKLSPLATAPFDVAAFLAPGSDPVALLVLAHQTQMHNLITLTNYKTRLALYAYSQATVPATVPASLSLPDEIQDRFEHPAEQLLRYLLFTRESPLAGPAEAQSLQASAFAREFAARGVRDPKGRSLRDFDLNTRIFRYPCSYLIYSADFDAIPEPAKGYIYHRLLEILSGRDQSQDFARLSAEDRQATLEILLTTKSGLPEEWGQYAASHQLQIAKQ